jgi:hypothetical protein
LIEKKLDVLRGERFPWGFEIDIRYHETRKQGNRAELLLAGALCKEVIDLLQSGGTGFMQRSAEEKIL